jgi:HPt (histidine-containing phosphotransfer) domain-containing protein
LPTAAIDEPHTPVKAERTVVNTRPATAKATSLTLAAEQVVLEVEEDELNVTFDPTYLEKMTFGDREQLVKILDRFREDCSNDIEELKDAVLNNHSEVAELLVHRLAGRIAQVGSKSLAAEFRKLEYRIREAGTLDTEIKEEILEVIPTLSHLIEVIKRY